MGSAAFDHPILNFPLDLRSPIGRDDDRIVKNLLISILDRWHDWKNVAVYKLCSTSVSLIRFFTQSLPFYLPLLNKKFVPMSEQNNSQVQWTMKSMREELELSRTRGGRDRQARNYSPDRLLKHHDDQQAHITESMLQMTSSLKAQSVDANQIIKRDIRRLESAKMAAENNTSALTTASGQLAACSKDNTNWCLIILVIVVFMIFINMVIFIKFMKKS